MTRLICHHGQHARVVIGGYQVLGGHRISHESGYHSTATKLQINLNSVKRGLLKKGNTKTFKVRFCILSNSRLSRRLQARSCLGVDLASVVLILL